MDGMNELIERLAREAGIDINADTLCRYDGWSEPMRRFAALVAEECAKVADGHAQAAWERDRSKACARAAFDASAAIRAKFKMP
jgi:hypothetical protein